MVNNRVRNLDALLAQLRASGAKLDDRVEDYDYSRSAGRPTRRAIDSSYGSRAHPDKGYWVWAFWGMATIRDRLGHCLHGFFTITPPGSPSC
jgi:hypothetical protein